MSQEEAQAAARRQRKLAEAMNMLGIPAAARPDLAGVTPTPQAKPQASPEFSLEDYYENSSIDVYAGAELPSLPIAEPAETNSPDEPARSETPTVPANDERLAPQDRPALHSIQKQLHSLKPESPRGQVASAVAAQSSQKLPPHIAYQGSDAGRELLQRRNPDGETIDSGAQPPVARAGVAYVPEQLPASGAYTDAIAQLGKQTVANHELEHATKQQRRDATEAVSSEDVSSTIAPNNEFREIGPTIGDVVFRAEQFEMDEGKQLDLDVKLPGGKTHDVNWMKEQAKQHGYFDGQSMHSLLFETPAGQQYVKQMAQRQAMIDKTAASASTVTTASASNSPVAKPQTEPVPSAGPTPAQATPTIEPQSAIEPPRPMPVDSTPTPTLDAPLRVDQSGRPSLPSPTITELPDSEPTEMGSVIDVSPSTPVIRNAALPQPVNSPAISLPPSPSRPKIASSPVPAATAPATPSFAEGTISPVPDREPTAERTAPVPAVPTDAPSPQLTPSLTPTQDVTRSTETSTAMPNVAAPTTSITPPSRPVAVPPPTSMPQAPEPPGTAQSQTPSAMAKSESAPAAPSPTPAAPSPTPTAPAATLPEPAIDNTDSPATPLTVNQSIASAQARLFDEWQQTLPPQEYLQRVQDFGTPQATTEASPQGATLPQAEVYQTHIAQATAAAAANPVPSSPAPAPSNDSASTLTSLQDRSDAAESAKLVVPPPAPAARPAAIPSPPPSPAAVDDNAIDPNDLAPPLDPNDWVSPTSPQKIDPKKPDPDWGSLDELPKAKSTSTPTPASTPTPKPPTPKTSKPKPAATPSSTPSSTPPRGPQAASSTELLGENSPLFPMIESTVDLAATTMTQLVDLLARLTFEIAAMKQHLSTIQDRLDHGADDEFR